MKRLLVLIGTVLLVACAATSVLATDSVSASGPAPTIVAKTGTTDNGSFEYTIDGDGYAHLDVTASGWVHYDGSANNYHQVLYSIYLSVDDNILQQYYESMIEIRLNSTGHWGFPTTGSVSLSGATQVLGIGSHTAKTYSHIEDLNTSIQATDTHSDSITVMAP